jgi:hypothetical protein
MAEITKQALVVDNNQSFPNNNNGQITPAVLRAFNTNMIDSTVNQTVYTADSASFNSQIAAISGAVAPDTGSLLITASAVGNVMTFTKANASTFNVTVGSVIPTGTISGSAQITALGFVSSSVTGSSLVTGSVSGNTLTFTKGDASTFTLTVATGSGASIDTGSFATTGSNTFTGNQTISGSDKNGIFFKTGSSDFFVGQNLSDNLIVSSSSQSKYIEFVKSNGWIEVNSSQVNFNGQTTLRGNTEARKITQEVGYPVIINGTLSASLATGYAFVGGGDGYSKQVPTASFSSASLVTGSVNVNVLTFTKGDGSTFNLTVAASGSAPEGTISGSAQITALGFVSSSGGDTGSLMRTGSVSGNVLTFTKGDATTFTLTVETGSGGGGGGATLGANTFTGSQTIETSSVLRVGSSDEYIQTSFNSFTLKNKTGVYVNYEAPDTYFQSYGNFAFKNAIGGNGSGSMNFTIENGGSYSTQVQGSGTIAFTTNTGSITLTTPDILNLQSNVLKLKSADASFTTQIINASGSLMLATAAQSTASAYIAQSSPANQVNLIFKNNSNTGDTIISGSNNIFTNPATPTTGYTRYIGGSNNLYLNSTNGINSQITQSAASVSGTRPTMNNNIFNGDTNFLINQAVNTGTHTYSHNKIGGTNATITINALSHTGSVNILANTVNNAAITINASSASVAEIAAGISGSGTVSVNSNFIQGAGITSTSPRTLLTSNTQQITNNVSGNGNITITNISSSAGVNAIANFANSNMSYTNAGAAGLGLHTTAGAINGNYGGATIIASGSAVSFTNNINTGNNLTVTNQAFSGSLGVGVFNIFRNIFSGQSMTLLITGSVDGSGNTTGAFTDNAVIGKNNTIFSNQTGADVHNSFISNVVGGERLIISASNSFNSTIGGGAYFGRWNADDGVRNKTGQTVFSVGTGISGSRKTGFLIDSGSNTFVEGSLNVSGSTQFTGSISIAPTFQLNLPTGSNQQAGTAVLDGANPGTVTVSNSLVTANSIIMVSKQTLAHPNGYVAVSAKGSGTFTITSNHNGDTDTVGWFIINNS